MRLKILTIGKMKKGPETDLLDRYLERAEKAGRQLGFSGPEVSEWTESRLDQVELRKSEEAKTLLSGLKPGALLIAMDEHGKDYSSVELSQTLSKALDSSVPEVAFALGGPDGHAAELLKQSTLTLRMGKMTWPHQLARVMLAEQIYRSITILSGHPYHRV
ncbi:MAG: 23S rRNA (pseudouridine(1915)-N(3))-methyltransferase RlmH [Salaquimonas sp.]